MELLAQARPASLDPADADAARAGETARALAAGAPPVTAGIAAPVGARRASAPVPAQRPRRRRALLAGAGLTATAAGTAFAVALATGGAPQAAQQAQTPSAVLTAAMVRHVASASQSALATSGKVLISYRTSQRGVPQVSGADNIRFAGKNWNDAISQSFPATAGAGATSQHAADRVVDGRFYLYTIGASGRWEWIHETNPTGQPSMAAADPRKLLRVLTPAAGFAVAGHRVIGGARLKGLRATSFAHLPRLNSLFSTIPGGRVTSLTVWVDSHDVVRQMDASVRQNLHSYVGSKKDSRGRTVYLVPNQTIAKRLRDALARKGARGVVVRVRHGESVQHEVQVTAVSVTFSAIGQPQRISAPRHVVNIFGRG
jgi:hypothetical protein